MNDSDLVIKLGKPAGDSRIEVVRSFTMKCNLGNYESADFFCSAKQNCLPEQADDLSERLYYYCRKEVLKNAAEFTRERPDLVARNQQRRSA